jgi:L-lactate dehydrogenase complex protein LldF
MQSGAIDFNANVRAARADAALQRALGGLPRGLVARRAAAKAALPEFESLRVVARDIRTATLRNLDVYLETFAESAERAGSRVHFAVDAETARRIVSDICRESGARLVLKGKSMVSEEIALNSHLEAQGFEVVETDLGEYILQLRGEAPSHIIAPAIHLTHDDVEADFRRHHSHLPSDRPLAEAADLVGEARSVLRAKFLAADVGITGANFLIAETGSSVIVTNEGNGDLTQTLPRVHIVLASIDKVVPTLEDAMVLLRLLARSATGQEMTAYTTFATGPRRADDKDGPEVCHIVILDNRRSALLGTEAAEVLNCIRCGACMNHCPVYGAIGGHAYGSVYAGPIGAALTPALGGIGAHRDLPNASSFCGRCEEVCPVKIPLVRILRHWRAVDHVEQTSPVRQRAGLLVWSFLARRPRLYHLVARFGAALFSMASRRHGKRRSFPFARSWTATRDLPAPQGRTFQQLWTEARRGVPR